MAACVRHSGSLICGCDAQKTAPAGPVCALRTKRLDAAGDAGRRLAQLLRSALNHNHAALETTLGSAASARAPANSCVYGFAQKDKRT